MGGLPAGRRKGGRKGRAHLEAEEMGEVERARVRDDGGAGAAAGRAILEQQLRVHPQPHLVVRADSEAAQGGGDEPVEEDPVVHCKGPRQSGSTPQLAPIFQPDFAQWGAPWRPWRGGGGLARPPCVLV